MGLSKIEELRRRKQEALAKAKKKSSSTSTSRSNNVEKETENNSKNLESTERQKIRDRLAKAKEDRLKKLRESLSSKKSDVNSDTAKELEREKNTLNEKLKRMEADRESLEYELRLKIHHLMEELNILQHQLSKQQLLIDGKEEVSTENRDISSHIETLEVENIKLKHAVLQFKQMWEALPVESQHKNRAEVEALQQELDHMREQLDHTMEAQEMVEMISQQNYELEEHKQKFEDIVEVLQEELTIADEMNVLKDEAMLLVREEYEQQKVHFLKLSKQVDQLKKGLEERNLEIAKMQTTIAHKETKIKQTENQVVQKTKSLDLLKDRYAWDNTLETMTSFFDKQMLTCYMQQMEKLRHFIFQFFPKSVVKKELSGVHATYLLKITELKCQLLAKTLMSQEKLHKHDFCYASIVLNSIAFTLNSIRYSIQTIEQYHQLGMLLPTVTSIQHSINSIELEFKQNFKVFTKDFQTSITNSFVSLLQQLQYFRHGLPLTFLPNGKHFILCDTFGSYKMMLAVLLQLVEGTSNSMDDLVPIIEEGIKIADKKKKVDSGQFKTMKISIEQLYEPIIYLKQLLRKNSTLFKGKHEKTIISEKLKVAIFDTMIPVWLLLGQLYDKVHSLSIVMNSAVKQMKQLNLIDDDLLHPIQTLHQFDIKLFVLDVKSHPLIGSMGSFLAYICNLTHGMCEETTSKFVKSTLEDTFKNLNLELDALNDVIIKTDATISSSEKFNDIPRETQAKAIQDAFESISPLTNELRSSKLEIKQLSTQLQQLEQDYTKLHQSHTFLKQNHEETHQKMIQLEGYEKQFKAMRPILSEKEALTKHVKQLKGTVASLQHQLQVKSSVPQPQTQSLDIKGKQLLEEQINHMSRTIQQLDNTAVEQRHQSLSSNFETLFQAWQKEDDITRQWQEKLQMASKVNGLFPTPTTVIKASSLSQKPSLVSLSRFTSKKAWKTLQHYCK